MIMTVSKRIQTNTIDTKYEYDNGGKLVHEVTTKTFEIPDEPVVTHKATACICESPDNFDFDDEYDIEIEESVSPLKILASISCIASIVASGCLIFKTLRNKN